MKAGTTGTALRLAAMGAVAAGAALAGFVPAPAAAADLPGDPAAGKALALRWCANCHLVAEGQQNPAVDGVAPFAVIARDARSTEFRLRAFLQTPHDRMPNIMLTRKETDDVVGYILSLKRR